MREITLENWNRKEHYQFFRRMDYPVYNICFDLDVTRYRRFAKKAGLSFNNALLYLSTRTLNDIENFRFRCRDGNVIIHDITHPSFTAMSGESGLFKLATVDYQSDIRAFNASALAASRADSACFPLDQLKGRDDLIFFSAIPWITFTSLDHTINLNKDDAVPRITWGKFQWRGLRLMLPYNMQVSHLFVDGYHLGIYREKLDENMRLIIAENRC